MTDSNCSHMGCRCSYEKPHCYGETILLNCILFFHLDITTIQFRIFCYTSTYVGIFNILYFHDFILVLFLRLLVLSIKIIILIFFIYYFNFLDFLDSFYIASTHSVIHNFSRIVNFPILDLILYCLDFYCMMKSESNFYFCKNSQIL